MWTWKYATNKAVFWQSLRKFMDTKVSTVLVLGVSIFVDSARLIVC